jgi:hypothetical protein
MSDLVLRKKLIRLAQQKPELREHLVPLLRQASALPQEDPDEEDNTTKVMPLSLCVSEYRAMEMKLNALFHDTTNPVETYQWRTVHNILREAGFKFKGWQNGAGLASNGRYTLLFSPSGLHKLPVCLAKRGKTLSGCMGTDSHELLRTVFATLIFLGGLPKNFDLDTFQELGH